ncbi:MAG: DUF389 domain-containing protein [Cyanobacteria bacterium J06638_20]
MLKSLLSILRAVLTMILTLFVFRQRVPSEKINELRRALFGEARLESSFVALVVGSGLIATFGLLNNSAAIIIGAMIIAPLMRPIRAMAFGILDGNLALLQRSLRSILVGSVITITLAAVVTSFLQITEFGSEVMSRTEPNLLDMGVAVVAGAISAYAKVEEKIGDAVAGTAIAVALAPPLCVVGLGLPSGITDNGWNITQGSLLLFLTNWLGITFACMIVFIMAGYTPANTPRTRRALSVTAGMTLLLMIPLGLSLKQLLQETILTQKIRTILNETETFGGEQVTFDELKVNWRKRIPEVDLSVSSITPPTPRQVRLVEQFLSDEMNQQFHLIVYVIELQEVRPEEDPVGCLCHQTLRGTP